MSGRGVHDVLLDRDGVINRHRTRHVLAPAQLELLPGAAGAIQRLCRSGHRVIVVTNQSAVGRGLLSVDMLAAIHDRLQELVTSEHGGIDRFFVCPHHPRAGCGCRKPKPGLLFAARDQAGVDLRDAVLIGDMPSDVAAARAAGCRAILVGEQLADGVPHADDLAGAVDLLIGAPIPC
jgi:D-glycero-D-manno-heptose 1,7-bisphosphate phosphatase